MFRDTGDRAIFARISLEKTAKKINTYEHTNKEVFTMKIETQTTRKGASIPSCKFTEQDIEDIFSCIKLYCDQVDEPDEFVVNTLAQLLETASNNPTFKWGGITERHYMKLKNKLITEGITLDLPTSKYYDHSEAVDRKAIFDRIFAEKEQPEEPDFSYVHKMQMDTRYSDDEIKEIAQTVASLLNQLKPYHKSRILETASETLIEIFDNHKK